MYEAVVEEAGGFEGEQQWPRGVDEWIAQCTVDQVSTDGSAQIWSSLRVSILGWKTKISGGHLNLIYLLYHYDKMPIKIFRIAFGVRNRQRILQSELSD